MEEHNYRINIKKEKKKKKKENTNIIEKTSLQKKRKDMF
jgi:hypothetical protein